MSIEIKSLSGVVLVTLSCDSLVRTDLRYANLTNADLRYVNLRGANLGGANLRGANLYDAYLRGAYLEGAKLPHFQICPEVGSFTAFKSVMHEMKRVVIRVRVPKHAKRTSSIVGRKCRAEAVRVLSGEGRSPTAANKLFYKKGETVVADKYDDDIRVECAGGIHFFMTRAEAEEYV